MPRPRALLTAALASAAVLVVPSGVAHAADGDPSNVLAGTVTAADGVLWNGCHTYAYSYALQPTTATWYLETRLLGPDGAGVASGLVISDSDPTTGSATFGVCSRATSRGAFRIEARLTSTSGSNQTTEELPPASFTLGLPASASALRVADASPQRGERVVFTLTSTRQTPEGMVPNDLATVVLQRRTAAGWRRVGGGLTETNTHGRVRVRVTWHGGRERYRMLTRADPDAYAGSRSAATTLRTAR
ncbi:hypothetical protein [Nocardioides bigeumensis]|uniref:Uncharacterized protein n=1 Tax=Nocardioides bigeumensis TaxID=433657 RepID=A0ABP5J9P8_9ACTN